MSIRYGSSNGKAATGLDYQVLIDRLERCTRPAINLVVGIEVSMGRGLTEPYPANAHKGGYHSDKTMKAILAESQVPRYLARTTTCGFLCHLRSRRFTNPSPCNLSRIYHKAGYLRYSHPRKQDRECELPRRSRQGVFENHTSWHSSWLSREDSRPGHCQKKLDDTLQKKNIKARQDTKRNTYIDPPGIDGIHKNPMRLGKILGGCARQHVQGGLCHVRVRMPRGL
jgi:hypothetical protein